MERVLVCILASTRAHKLTFASFKRQVLDELNADLALALILPENYDYANPFWQHAKYRWTAPHYGDMGEGFDLAQSWLCAQRNVAPTHWRSLLRIKGIWQGGIRSTDPQPSASSVLIFCRWLLLHGLQQDGILDRYDRFVITRSDFVWWSPHPPLSILDPNSIWSPNGEDYGGLNDRHLVLSRADVVECLNIIEDILLYPTQLYEDMKDQPVVWNDEQMLAQHLRRKGLLKKVKRFPYVMYTARPADDEGPTWSWGRYEPTVKHYVKYDNEFHAAKTYGNIIRCRADWESGIWKTVSSSSPSSNRTPLSIRLRFVCESSYFKIRSALRRPQRVQRFAGFCKRMLCRLTAKFLAKTKTKSKCC